ncbi:MAG: PAS domain S-box protein [Deltaproteobacteria bacterium]|nr:PAS domain S-box protein [Deltaproteobacteria bacterium]
MENALREQEERYRTLAEFATNWIFWLGPNGEMLYVSPSCETISGYPPSRFYESRDMFLYIVHPDDREKWLELSRRMETDLVPGQLELRIVDRQGETRWIKHRGRPVFGENGRYLGIRGSNSDITERKAVEKALRDSEERLRDFFDNAIDLIESVTPDGRFLFVNRAWRESLGYTAAEVEGLSVTDVIAPECRDRHAEMLRQVMAGENLGHIETTFLSKDGRRILVEGHINCRLEDGKPVAGRGIFRDVTRKKQMEEELRKSNMLESIGILAGGIAHDFNNILTAVMGYLSLAKLGVEPGDQTWSRLVEAEKAAIRAQSLTRQLLTFSKGGAPVRQASSIGQLIEESANFALRGSTIKCRIAIAPDLFSVDIDPGQIGQVINNIVLNAAQAMPGGGVIDVDARNIALGKIPGGSLAPGEYVKIEVVDHGTGISEENVNKIFNPFFTTKAKGTGLGLATAYSIVKRHEGAITVDSALGRGTTVSIFLPVARKSVQEIPAIRTAPYEGIGKILVMDDEEMVRDVAVSMLETMGYESQAVKDGSEAVDAYLEAMKAGIPFDVVILDLTVPGAMGGKEAVRKLLDIDPGAKVIVSSGYSQDPILAMYRDYGFSGVIAKPYQMGELGQAIKLLLPGTAPSRH